MFRFACQLCTLVPVRQRGEDKLGFGLLPARSENRKRLDLDAFWGDIWHSRRTFSCSLYLTVYNSFLYVLFTSCYVKALPHLQSPRRVLFSRGCLLVAVRPRALARCGKATGMKRFLRTKIHAVPEVFFLTMLLGTLRAVFHCSPLFTFPSRRPSVDSTSLRAPCTDVGPRVYAKKISREDNGLGL